MKAPAHNHVLSVLVFIAVFITLTVTGGSYIGWIAIAIILIAGISVLVVLNRSGRQR
jgi:hypothetical protein